MVEFIRSLIDVLVETFITATGRGVLRLFGLRRPHDIASLFAGMACWALVAILIWAVVAPR
ncbi:hypothetical protein [Bradyrhizobium stylosanthis]|uniref:Uncharacterized protein n=1 Tax=Bradyrhizobium stylosanthis TaxID=1803665 RepID=A0A560E647_9BRAD|nr:hypothetical protein [Bradyrhizobium stylosanthis]TWB04770.1 hypothetical protein FBZ96_1021251 [Bradyrhizobium stylosanthis]